MQGTKNGTVRDKKLSIRILIREAYVVVFVVNQELEFREGLILKALFDFFGG